MKIKNGAGGKRDRARSKTHSRKQDSGRSVFKIQEIQISRARKQARKDKK